jgi:signal transduction histidine kinase
VVTSTAATHVPRSDGAPDPVVDAARFQSVGPVMDCLLHDVRNPLNAISINLEVLTEKLKLQTGQVPAPQEKNLRAMREQLQRVDGLLRRFADVLQHRPAGAGVVDLTQGVGQVLEALTYECRRRRIEVQASLEPGVRAHLEDMGELPFLVVQPLLRAVGLLGTNGRLSVAVRAEGDGALLEVVDGASQPQSAPEVVAALTLACDRLGVELRLAAGTCGMRFKRA